MLFSGACSIVHIIISLVLELSPCLTITSCQPSSISGAPSTVMASSLAQTRQRFHACSCFYRIPFA